MSLNLYMWTSNDDRSPYNNESCQGEEELGVQGGFPLSSLTLSSKRRITERTGLSLSHHLATFSSILALIPLLLSLDFCTLISTTRGTLGTRIMGTAGARGEPP